MEWRRFVTYLWNDPRIAAYWVHYSIRCLPIFITFVHITVQKICNFFLHLFSYSIQFLYEYYRTEKQERFCLLSMLLLYIAVIPVSCSCFLKKFVQSPHSPTFIWKFLIKFFCPTTFRTYKFSISLCR